MKIGDTDVLLSDVIPINLFPGPVIRRVQHFSVDDADEGHSLHPVALFGTAVASRAHTIACNLTETKE